MFNLSETATEGLLIVGFIIIALLFIALVFHCYKGLKSNELRNRIRNGEINLTCNMRVNKVTTEITVTGYEDGFVLYSDGTYEFNLRLINRVPIDCIFIN